MQKSPIKKFFPTRRVKIAQGAEAHVFIRTRDRFGANLESHFPKEGIAKRRFLATKIAHLLFPKNTPNPRFVEGNVMHSKYLPPHTALRDYHRTIVKISAGMENWTETAEAGKRMAKLYRENRFEIEKLKMQLESAGIPVDDTDVNVAIRPQGIVFYDIGIIPKRVRKNLGEMHIPESRKRVILKLLEQYEAVK